MTDARTLDAGDRLDRAEQVVLDAMLLASQLRQSVDEITAAAQDLKAEIRAYRNPGTFTRPLGAPCDQS